MVSRSERGSKRNSASYPFAMLLKQLIKAKRMTQASVAKALAGDLEPDKSQVRLGERPERAEQRYHSQTGRGC